MNTERGERLQAALSAWGQRLRSAGLAGLVDALLGVSGPLSLLGAQVLWVAQPALGLLVSRRMVGDLAALLSEPDGLDRLREMLLGSEDDDECSI